MIWVMKVNSFILKTTKILYIIFSFYYYGLVAQMVDRRLGMAEAPGSNPGQSIYKFSKKIKFKIVIKL